MTDGVGSKDRARRYPVAKVKGGWTRAEDDALRE